MSSWERGNKSSRRGLADRDSDRDQLFNLSPTRVCIIMPPQRAVSVKNGCESKQPQPVTMCAAFRRYWDLSQISHYGESLGIQKGKGNARRVMRRSQRQSWIRYVSSLTSSTTSKQLWKKS
ncbi:hypothetical protein TNCV_99701 [Trichonephila clavipes]|nr:hypothetical protein TNCV_99701 [Trichonephila clavipes]